MHRREYVLIEKVLRRAKNIAEERDVETGFMENIISDFCSALKEDSNSFNETKFREFIQKGE